MEIVIYPYKLIQRTEYSKFRILDDKGTNISDSEIGEKILEDYNKQLLNPEKYFEIYDNILNKVLEPVKDENIKYLFIPEGITKIAYKSINFQNIEYISLPNTLKKIESTAFAHSAIKAIELPASIENVGEHCFCGCKLLEYVKLPSNFTTLSKFMFEECEKLKEINIPDNLKTISQFCFYECKSLKKIIIPDTVEKIETIVFSGCRKLEYIKLPSNLNTIGDGLFDGCENLKEIDIPDSVVKIGREVFWGVNNLDSITLPRDLNTMGWRPFCGSGIKTLVFKHDLKYLNGNDPKGNPTNLIYQSKINKLIINKEVQTITPDVVGMSGSQINTIDYLGTKQEFEKFKENNKKLFDLLPNLENVNFAKDENLQSNHKLNYEIDNNICL